MKNQHQLPNTKKLSAVVLSLSLFAAACGSTNDSIDEAALTQLDTPVALSGEMVSTASPSGVVEVEIPAEWDSVDVEPVSFFNNKGFGSKFKNSGVFKKNGFNSFNKFNNNKKFGNGFNSFKQFNSKSKGFNNQFNNQFKKFNNFNNFGGNKLGFSNNKFGNGFNNKGLGINKNGFGFKNNFNNFNNFNNKGFNGFNTFGVNGKKGFNNNNFFKQGGRNSVFGFVAFEEVDAEIGKDLDMKMLDWIPTGDNPMMMAKEADSGVTILSNEQIEQNGMKGMRTIFEIEVGDGEKQMVAQQALIDDAGEHLAVVVAGCETSCFEDELDNIVEIMDSTKRAL